MPLTPTGATHEVGVEDMFFSTTDAKGVIKKANNVFVRLSRFSGEQLVHAPHNLIRHPEMPGGAFHAMWATLESGAPFAAYVRNLASDGSEYDVFATVTPMRNGDYLSVRIRPMAQELFDTVLAVYRSTLELETRAREAGANRRDAAAQGAGAIVEAVQGLGLASYEDFQNLALPSEMAIREQMGLRLPERPEAQGVYADALRHIHALNEELNTWMHRQDELAELGAQLNSAGKRFSKAMAPQSLSAQTVAQLDRSDSRVSQLAELLDLWIQMQAIVSTQVTQLQDALSAMNQGVGRMRFRIALARLHAFMVANFLAELIDHGDNTENAVLTNGGIQDLLEAVEDGLTDLQAQTERYRTLIADTIRVIEQAQRVLTIPRQLLMLWTSNPAAEDPTLPELAQSLSRDVTRAVEMSGDSLASLTELVEHCRRLADVDDTTALLTQIREIQATLG